MDQTSLCQAKLKGAEFTRKKLDDVHSLRRRHKYTVNSMDNTIGSELYGSVILFEFDHRKTYNINRDYSAVEINSQATETNVGAQSLHFARKVLTN